LGVENLMFLFTDLKDSTPMYEEMGDAHAFALVIDHFAILTTEIRNHNEAVVKTIGDASHGSLSNKRRGTKGKC
jgi:class 3 adenylate cyclase